MNVTGHRLLVKMQIQFALMCQAAFVVSVNKGFTGTLVFVLVRMCILT